MRSSDTTQEAMMPGAVCRASAGVLRAICE